MKYLCQYFFRSRVLIEGVTKDFQGACGLCSIVEAYWPPVSLTRNNFLATYFGFIFLPFYVIFPCKYAASNKNTSWRVI